MRKQEENQFDVQVEMLKAIARASAPSMEEAKRREKAIDNAKHNTKAFIALLDEFNIPYPGK